MNRNSKAIAVITSLSLSAVIVVLLWILVPQVAFWKILTLFAASSAASFAAIRLSSKYLLDQLDRLRYDLRKEVGETLLNEGDSQDAFGEIVSLVTSSLEHKQAEIERLKRQEVFRKDFIADVSHELKTPIFAAQGFVHTLLDGAVKEKNVRKKFLKKAAKSLDGLDMLVQDLLTLSQIETGQIKMRFKTFDLYTLTEEVFDQFKSKVNKKDITLRIEGAVGKVSAYGDPLRIGQVMTNLISNAIKHSGEGTEVVVSFSVRKNSVTTYVKDEGEGIPAEHINRIFERFYRVDKSRSREKGGTGLGLAIVKHILDGHQTRAEVVSEPGKGATFSFELSRDKPGQNPEDENGRESDI